MGVTIFELMTFNYPFKGKNDKEIMENIMKDNKNDYNFSYSYDLKTLINTMISKDPEKRPSPSDILEMAFIKKRMENYVNENRTKLLEAKKTISIFDNLDEIESIPEDNEVNNEKTEDKKKEITILDYKAIEIVNKTDNNNEA